MDNQEDVLQDDPNDMTIEVEDEGATDEGPNPLFNNKLPKYTVEVYDEEGNVKNVLTYHFRRMSSGDIFKVLKIVASSSAGIAKLQGSGSLDSGSNIAWAIVASLPHAEAYVKDFLSSLLTYTEKGKDGKVASAKSVHARDFDDYNLFPLGATFDLVNNLAIHPDIRTLIKNARGLSEMPIMEEVRNQIKVSQESKG